MELIDHHLRSKLNSETGRIGWKELERYFARGVLIVVDPELDLVQVAACMADDDREAVEKWLTSGQVARASSDDAMGWNERNPEFWAVVTAPWVLVQEIRNTA